MSDASLSEAGRRGWQATDALFQRWRSKRLWCCAVVTMDPRQRHSRSQIRHGKGIRGTLEEKVDSPSRINGRHHHVSTREVPRRLSRWNRGKILLGDSQTVLTWIRSASADFKPFVSARVQEIQHAPMLHGRV